MEDRNIKKSKEKINSINGEISKLVNEINDNLDPDKKLEMLNEIMRQYKSLRIEYQFLEKWENCEHRTDINYTYEQEIGFFSQFIEILKKRNKDSYIRYDIYLDIARLQYEYFNYNKNEFTQKIKHHEGVFFGPTPIIEANQIFQNLRNAQTVIEKLIQDKRKTLDSESLYLYFEILGDTYINVYAFLIELESVFADKYNLDHAFYCYEEASKNKKKTELPGIYREGITNMPYLPPYYDFFKERHTNIYDVDAKLSFLFHKFSDYLERKTKSYCWKTGNYCEYREDKIYEINEGNGVFISMNYGIQKNFLLYEYIKKILEIFKLKPILKQERLRSPSWTKEICCTVFNNKYSMVLLDKYSPNVVLELGMSFGMGRKTIILINENQEYQKNSVEDQLFSMVRDYDCTTYRNVEQFFNNLIRSINGIFLNKVDYEIPDIHMIFNDIEIESLNNIILKSNNKD